MRFGGEQTDSNQRLIYTWAWASPQKCRAVGLVAAVKSHLMTASFWSPHSITYQWIGFSLTIPQISHWNSFRLDMPSPLSDDSAKTSIAASHCSDGAAASGPLPCGFWPLWSSVPPCG